MYIQLILAIFFSRHHRQAAFRNGQKKTIVKTGILRTEVWKQTTKQCLMGEEENEKEKGKRESA